MPSTRPRPPPDHHDGQEREIVPVVAADLRQRKPQGSIFRALAVVDQGFAARTSAGIVHEVAAGTRCV